MRSGSRAFQAILGIALFLFALATFALSRLVPVVIDSGLAAFHTIAGLCGHVIQATFSELVNALALASFLGITFMLGRFTSYAVCMLRNTRIRIEPLLAARTAFWPINVVSVGSQLRITAWLDVVDQPAPFAFCYGFIHPRICISTGLLRLLEPAELGAVLLHEDHHRRQRDPLRVLMVRALGRSLFFIPSVRDLCIRHDITKEFAADEAAVYHYGSVKPMAGALYKVLTCPTSMPDLRAAAIGELTVTERRIDHLLTPRSVDVPPLSRARLAISCVTFGVVAFSLLVMTVVNTQPLVHLCRI